MAQQGGVPQALPPGVALWQDARAVAGVQPCGVLRAGVRVVAGRLMREEERWPPDRAAATVRSSP